MKMEEHTYILLNKKYKIYNSDLQHYLGQGSYGIAYKAYLIEDTDNKNPVVIKRIERSKQSQINISEEMQCMTQMKYINAKHVIQLLDNFEDSTFWNLVEPYYNAKSLEAYLNENVLLSESLVKNFISQVIDGLISLHSNGYIHRDLKLENIMLNRTSDDDRTLELTLIDLGMSKHKEPDHLYTTYCGSPYVMAPEIFKKKPYSRKVDIYSIGILTLMMLTGTSPYTKLEQILKIGKKGHDCISISPKFNISLCCISFIEQCIQCDPNERPDILDLKLHPFIAEPIKYELLPGLQYEEGEIKISHTNHDHTNELNKLLESEQGKEDVYVEHTLQLVKDK